MSSHALRRRAVGERLQEVEHAAPARQIVKLELPAGVPARGVAAGSALVHRSGSALQAARAQVGELWVESSPEQSLAVTAAEPAPAPPLALFSPWYDYRGASPPASARFTRATEDPQGVCMHRQYHSCYACHGNRRGSPSRAFFDILDSLFQSTIIIVAVTTEGGHE